MRNRLVYARATTRENVIVGRRLGAKHKKRAKSTLVRSRTEGLSNPSVRGRVLLYVRSTRHADHLKLRSVGGHGKGRTIALAADRDAVVDGARRPPRLRDRHRRHPPAPADHLGGALSGRRARVILPEAPAVARARAVAWQ